MKTMQTRIILSHIVYGAKPCYDQKIDANDYDDEDSSKKSKNKRKRKITKRN